MRNKAIAALAILALWGAETVQAKENPPVSTRKRAELAWSELAGILVESRIWTKLPDGTKIQGEVLAVRPEALVMDVAKTSNRKLHPKGQSEIPREQVRELKVVRDNGPMKAVGGVAGGMGSAILTSVAAYAIDSAALGLVGLLVILPVGIIGGYYAGKRADRRTTLITIRAEGE